MKKLCDYVVPLLSLMGFGLVLYDIGFLPFQARNPVLFGWAQVLLYALSIMLALRLVTSLWTPGKRWSRLFNLSGWLYILFLAFYILPVLAGITELEGNRFLIFKIMLYAGFLLSFGTESSYILRLIYNRSVQPAAIFVGSFIFLIFIGTFLLLLPNATRGGIAIVDALFTATSAVCVTGLAVVDTATRFTTLGQLIILVLIQIGGLGIMTFAGLLAYAVGGRSTLKTELAFQDMLNTRQIRKIMHFIYQVVAVTFLFELIGTLAIYLSLDDALFVRKLDKLFFSIFHAVSAFCNAGFSTFTNGLFEPVIRHNYQLHTIIAFLIILGGIGFPIVFNLAAFVRVRVVNVLNAWKGNAARLYFPKLININSRLALIVTGILLAFGFVTYLLFEQYGTLRDHPGAMGKLVTAFFGAVTPRTGGFNSVDMSLLSLPMVLIYMFLMWIGASPGSMGGGIRTTTLGVAFLNLVSVLRGKDRAEFHRAEISAHSIRRAFAIIVLSFLLIGFFIFLVSINDGDKGLITISFETFSAFSTTGLSLGITPALTSQSKLVLVGTMFIGRVGLLTLFVAFIKQAPHLYYRYPREDVSF